MSCERFAHARAILAKERDKILEGLKGACKDRSLIDAKLALEEAVAILVLFDRHEIRKVAKATRLPPNATPSSDYRVISDNESDDPRVWTEVVIDGERVRPVGLSLIVEPDS
jgi:hypothetical protein